MSGWSVLKWAAIVANRVVDPGTPVKPPSSVNSCCGTNGWAAPIGCSVPVWRLAVRLINWSWLVCELPSTVADSVEAIELIGTVVVNEPAGARGRVVSVNIRTRADQHVELATVIGECDARDSGSPGTVIGVKVGSIFPVFVERLRLNRDNWPVAGS